jgi:ssDNA-binding Zn-finger/Zn-ribbon topoisomerase 1
MQKCSVCGKSGLYTEMIDYTVCSIHPKCEHTLFITSSCNVKEFKDCAVCSKILTIPRKEFRNHLINNHTKEAFADLILNIIH